jgi:colicin import membrane protein
MKARLSCLIWGLAVLPGAFALDAQGERAERERITAERARVEATFDDRQRACRERFVVTSCLEDARRDRRQALESLRQQQVILDEAQRKQRAAQRMDDIRAKVSGEEAQRREAIARDRRQEKQRGEVLRRASPDGAAPDAPAAPAPASVSAPDAARRVAEFEKRQAEAREHREAVERRNAERAAQGKAPAKPLPIPGGASAPR